MVGTLFYQTLKHAKTDAIKFPVAFPTLLCIIMLDRHLGLIIIADLPKKRESPLTIHHKIFGESHVPDIVGTSRTVPTAELMTKQEIMAALNETCVMSDKRKAQFELMIHALQKEDAGAVDEQAESEDDHTDEARNIDKRMRKPLEAAQMLNDSCCFCKL